MESLDYLEITTIYMIGISCPIGMTHTNKRASLDKILKINSYNWGQLAVLGPPITLDTVLLFIKTFWVTSDRNQL